MGKFLLTIFVLCFAADTSMAAPAASASKTSAKRKTRKARQQADEGITPFRYVAGGALSIFPGFGAGHAVQGRWWRDYGWVFTAGQAITFAGINEYDSRICFSSSDQDDYDDCQAENDRKLNVQSYWITAFALLKIGEVIHAWWPSKLAPLQRRAINPHAIAIPRHRYLWGGVLGTTVGFGSGHAVQGRWWRQGYGWAYTLTQLPILASLYGESARDDCERRAREKEQEARHRGENWGCDNPIGGDLSVSLIAMYFISKVIEIFNVWDIDYATHRVASNEQHDSLQVLPYIDTKSFGLQLAYSH